MGEVTTQNIRLKESREFKVYATVLLENLILYSTVHFVDFFCLFMVKNAVDKLMKRANIVVKRGTSSWKQQIIESINLEQGIERKIELCWLL